MPPTVSVILNCYNHQDYVGEAIESVLRQTHGDLELIIIDNGSTDDSRRVIQSYDDQRIRLILHDRNEPISRRLNEGIAAATGKFVAVLYSDDWMLPDKLERQVAIFRTLGPEYGVVYCPAVGFNQRTGERWQHRSMARDGASLKDLLRHTLEGAIDMSSPLTRRECFERYGWYEDLFGDGESIFFRIAMSWKFRFDPHPTVVLRDHSANMGKAVSRNHDMLMIILDRLAAHPELPAGCESELRLFRVRACRNNAWAVLRVGGPAGWARTQLGQAIGLQPSAVLHPRMIAAMALAALPRPFRTGLNRIGNYLRKRPENRTFVENY